MQLSRHKDYGKYNIHTYAFSGKGPRGINAMTLTVPEPDVKVSTTKKSATQYEVSVTNVPETITDVTVPVWSSKNDQDDLIWYKATKSGQGTYTVLVDTTKHHNDTGHYNAHVYGLSMVTGGLVGLKVSGFDNVDTRTNATIAVVNYSENKTSFDVVVTSDSNTKTINKVSVAVWSEDKGQDDLKWYTPTVKNNQAKMTVDIASHSNTSDKYNVHVYIDYADGSRVGTVVGAYKITKPSDLNRPEADTKVATDLTDKGIAIQVSSNQVKDYRDVRFAVWSEDKGQDDLKWYNADSKGKVVAAYEDHAGYGKYNVHTYMVSNGKMVGLNATSFTMPNPSAQTEIIKVDDLTYKVTVKNVPAYIDSVTVPVWSDRGDQDDIVWTKTDKENGIYIALVSLKEHHYDDGHYSAHIYGHSKIGNQTVGMAVTSGFTVPLADVSDKQQAVQVETRYKGTGNYEVNVTNIRQSGKLKIAIWSSKNDQDDLRWYETTPANHQATLRFNVTNHKDTGVYNIHIYQENGKKLEFLTSSNVQVDRANYDTPYYSQRDGRWASRWYGVSNLAATGCVPTTMAMVLTSLKGAQVLPTQVADYLYNQTVEFNRGTAGTTGQGILMAAKEWGVTATPLGTKNNLIQALKDGYHVLGAVQNDIFVMHGSHELVLKGYKAGKTHVSDPYTPSYSGWYSIDQLWNEQSHYSDDTRNIGAPFIKITDI